MTAQRDGLRELRDLEEVFKALAHATRRHILVVVRSRGGEMTAGDIAARFSCKWPTVSRHLKQLEEAGLLGVERNGREWIYKINQARLRSVAGNWLEFFAGEPS